MVRKSEARMGEGSPPKAVTREKPERVGRGKCRVALKYCGGCNPRYDRVALGEDLKRRVGQKVEWVSSEACNLDFVLAVEGCQTACADLSPFGGIKIHLITGPEQAERFILEMKGA